MKYPIPFRPWTGKASLEIEIPDDTEERFRLRAALEIAVERGSDLSGSDLRGSDLRGADLRSSDLSGSDLRGSDLRGSDLSGSDLSGADLRGSDLSDADFSGAKISNDLTLAGDRAIIYVCPIGSEDGVLLAYRTNKGIYLQRGCFFDTIDAFEAAVEDKHGPNAHGRVYRAALAMIREWDASQAEEKETAE